MAAKAAKAAAATTILFFLSLFASPIAGEPLNFSGYYNFNDPSPSDTLYDGFLLALPRVSSNSGNLRKNPGPPVLLLHGLFVLFLLRNWLLLTSLFASHKQAGDSWFLNSPEESLGFILADHGFDVWVGNVRGTRWSQRHVSLSVKDKDFWDWSWQELALHDLPAMLRYVNSVTNSKVFVVGHSQGTLMSLAGFTQRDIAEMVEAAGLLSPVGYLGHISSELILDMVNLHLDQACLFLVSILLSSIEIGESPFRVIFILLFHNMSVYWRNCCFNNSRVDFYLEFEPHPSSTKNLNHLFQMIRKDTFSKYDYGVFKNLMLYGQLKPPEFQIGDIPISLPLWIAYGGKDALADVTDVERAIKELKSTPDLVFLEKYGHLDFIVSVNAKEDMYDSLISFFKSREKSSSFK
ncbi:hypothetical protein TIFTF001_007090 [Ficus carica]|uniref:Lipase n=1 Tax=Ficus carica TaxID=3494 RepID=A0AA88ACL7_FICCA|nr:hypothetical protein TIFTF001_007090 [Ficus carica]